MTISLKIDNFDALPDGGPLTYTTIGRGFEIGREDRDWSLPDPNMFISGRHCEVRFENGGYWLYDVSRNGTFLNGARVQQGELLLGDQALHLGAIGPVVSRTTRDGGGDPGDDAFHLASCRHWTLPTTN